jgi:membrane protein implicated in regulation of membrane protease activity
MLTTVWEALLAMAVVLQFIQWVYPKLNPMIPLGLMSGTAVALGISLVVTENFWMSLALQLVAFMIVALVPAITFKLYFNKKRRKKTHTNLDALIGERCMVLEDISNIHVKGLVNLKGSIWSARCSDENDYIEQGTIVVVERVDGVKLICKREI